MTPVPVPSDEPEAEPARKRSASDFVFGKVIGEGSFSTVYLAKDIHTSKEFAIKVLEKQHIIREKKMDYVIREKNALLRLAPYNSLFVKLYATFQDSDRLYFVISYAKNGDLLSHLNANFPMECAKYYAAELVLALEVLKQNKIIHRDLKPENILLNDKWHILITDFGSSKIIVNDDATFVECSENERKNSFVGTAQYVTPEVLSNGLVTYAADLWALGCIIYQMITGSVPFKAPTDYLIFKKILSLNYEFPDDFNCSAKDLINKLLVLDPKARLGFDDDRPYASIRDHDFFAGIDFDNMGPPPPMMHNTIVESEPIQISEELQPGFDDHIAGQLQLELVSTALCANSGGSGNSSRKTDRELDANIANVGEEERSRRLEKQKLDKWHSLVEGNLILKQGLVDKRRGLFPKRRMLLLTLGPHLYYVDPVTMVLKGEIPWSASLKTEARNFKTFFVHTPNRTYYLEDPEGYALEWCKSIDQVKEFYYSQQPE